jgi:hypothetical protein
MDLDKLEAEREKATIDKADLFDFYHDNWDAVISELRELQQKQMAADFEPMRHFRD